MHIEIFMGEAYAPRLSALPMLVTAMAVLLVGFVSALKERGSRIVAPLALLSLSLAVWMLGTAACLSAVEETVAEFWVRIAVAGAAVAPAAVYQFVHRTMGLRPGQAQAVGPLMTAGVLFAATVLWTDLFVEGTRLYEFGYYSKFGTFGAMFTVYAAVTLALGLKALLTAYRRARPGTVHQRRARALLFGLVIACLSTVDLLPAYGFEVYPLGFATILAFFGLIAYVTWRFQLISITAASASRNIIETMGDALLVVDENDIIRLVNTATCELLGADARSLQGSVAASVFRGVDFADLRERILTGDPVRDVEMTHKTQNGADRILSLSASLMQDRAGEPVALVCLLSDVTDQKNAVENLNYLAFFDGLTGLPNLTSYEESLAGKLDTARTRGTTVTHFVVDLNRVKRINDLLGRDAGDELLKLAAERIEGCLNNYYRLSGARSGNLNHVTARLDGDKFVFAVDNVRWREDLVRIARRVLDFLAEPFMVQNQEVFVVASAGIAQFPKDADNIAKLMKAADIALESAKAGGRNTHRFYDDSMRADTVDRLVLERDLRRALDNNELELYYQPKYDLESSRITGSEALLRWNHPERGLVSPLDFIPLAEETGLIVQMGQWVINEACRQNREWHDEGFKDLHVAVNLSERQFRQNNLVVVVAQALDKSGMHPNLLQVELTESIIMRNVDETTAMLEELKGRGVIIAVDDFGTGYSSLSYLKRFPIDIIKIDRSFIRDIPGDPDDAAITEAIIAMAQSLKMDLVAEGVETRDQAAFLTERGCNIIQGYIISRPVPADEFLTLLHQRSSGKGQRAASVVPFSRGKNAG